MAGFVSTLEERGPEGGSSPVRRSGIHKPRCNIKRSDTDAEKKLGPAHGRRRDEFCAINTGAQWLTVSELAQLRPQIVPWSTLCRADWVRNDPVLTTRG